MSDTPPERPDDLAHPPRKPERPAGTQPVNAMTVLLGVGLTVVLHVAAGVALLTVGGFANFVSQDAGAIFAFPALFVGLSQVLWIGPAWFAARRRGMAGIALGLVIGASLTFLVNTACFGLLIRNLSY